MRRGTIESVFTPDVRSLYTDLVVRPLDQSDSVRKCVWKYSRRSFNVVRCCMLPKKLVDTGQQQRKRGQINLIRLQKRRGGFEFNKSVRTSHLEIKWIESSNVSRGIERERETCPANKVWEWVRGRDEDKRSVDEKRSSPCTIWSECDHWIFRFELWTDKVELVGATFRMTYDLRIPDLTSRTHMWHLLLKNKSLFSFRYELESIRSRRSQASSMSTLYASSLFDTVSMMQVSKWPTEFVIATTYRFTYRLDQSSDDGKLNFSLRERGGEGERKEEGKRE